MYVQYEHELHKSVIPMRLLNESMYATFYGNMLVNKRPPDSPKSSPRLPGHVKDPYLDCRVCAYQMHLRLDRTFRLDRLGSN